MDLYFILLFSFILLLIYRYLTRNYSYWEKQNIPWIKNPVPGFGNMLSLITLCDTIHDFIFRLYNSSDKSMVGFYFMSKPALMVRDPELVKCVLKTNFSNFRSNYTIKSQDPIMSKHPFFTPDMDVWKDRRLHVSNNLSNKKLRHIFVIAQDNTLKLSAYLDRKIEENGDFYECELKSVFVRYTCEVVANSALGIQGQSFHDNPDRMSFARIAKDLFELNLVNILKQAFIFYMPDVATFFRMKLVRDRTSNYFRENAKLMIEQRKQLKETPNDYLQFCIETVDENDMDTMVSDLLIFYNDTYETSSSVLGHLFYLLSLHPEIQDKLRQHIISKLDGKPPTYDSLESMTYLEQVLNESMRMVPPDILMMKFCTEEITLTGPDGLKCHVKPGFPVCIPSMNIHKDAKYWPNPEVFDPERFNPENDNPFVKLAFFPFSQGPRMCLGMRLGLLVMKLAIITTITRYSVEPSTKTKVPLQIDPTSLLTLYKGGVWAKFKKLKTCN